MKLNTQHKLFLKHNFQILIGFGIPLEILENPRKWYFFLQEGWDIETYWHYNLELSKEKQLKLYKLLKDNFIEACLAKEIAQKNNLEVNT